MALHAGAVHAATPVDAIQLSARDRTQIVQLACTGTSPPAAERIDAFLDQPGARALRADVRCQPQNVRDSLPVARLTRCDNRQGTWRCDTAREALVLALHDASRVAVLGEAVAPQTAVTVVREASRLTIPPFHRAATSLMKGLCTVYPTTGMELPGATHYGIDCDGGRLTLTRHCWREGCRYFIAQGQEHP